MTDQKCNKYCEQLSDREYYFRVQSRSDIRGDEISTVCPYNKAYPDTTYIKWVESKIYVLREGSICCNDFCFQNMNIVNLFVRGCGQICGFNNRKYLNFCKKKKRETIVHYVDRPVDSYDQLCVFNAKYEQVTYMSHLNVLMISKILRRVNLGRCNHWGSDYRPWYIASD